jgi:hypothetical protein
MHGAASIDACADFLTSAAQRGISLSISAASSAGLLPTTSMPSDWPSRCCTAGSFSARTTSAFRRCTTSFGVPRGAYSACHDTISKPLTPASAMVGTSGSSDERLGDVTASARNLPALIMASPAVS